MVKLLYKANNTTKTLSCLESGEGITIPKPYIRVNTSGYLPLTTQTSTGIKVQINGVQYSPIKETTVWQQTTITESFTKHNGDLGRSMESTTSHQTHEISFRAYGGLVRRTWTRVATMSFNCSASENPYFYKPLSRYENSTYENKGNQTYEPSDGWQLAYYAQVRTRTIFNTNYYIMMYHSASNDGYEPFIILANSTNPNPQNLILLNYSTFSSAYASSTSSYLGSGGATSASYEEMSRYLFHDMNRTSFYANPETVSIVNNTRRIGRSINYTRVSMSLTGVWGLSTGFTHYGSNYVNDGNTISIYTSNTSAFSNTFLGYTITSPYTTRASGYLIKNGPMLLNFTSSGYYTLYFKNSSGGEEISNVNWTNFAFGGSCAGHDMATFYTYSLQPDSFGFINTEDTCSRAGTYTSGLFFYPSNQYKTQTAMADIAATVKNYNNDYYRETFDVTIPETTRTITKVEVSYLGYYSINITMHRGCTLYTRYGFYGSATNTISRKAITQYLTSFNNTNSTYFVDTAQTTLITNTYTAMTTLAKSIYT